MTQKRMHQKELLFNVDDHLFFFFFLLLLGVYTLLFNFQISPSTFFFYLVHVLFVIIFLSALYFLCFILYFFLFD